MINTILKDIIMPINLKNNNNNSNKMCNTIISCKIIYIKMNNN